MSAATPTAQSPAKLKPVKLKPMIYKGASANCHFFHEHGGPIWCEVVDDGGIRFRRDLPAIRKPRGYSIRIYRDGEGEIADFHHEFRRDPGSPPSARTVGRLVRTALA